MVSPGFAGRDVTPGMAFVGSTYVPSVLVTVLNLAPVSLSTALTFAFGIAPDC